MTSELTKAHAAFIKQVGTIQEAETNEFHKSKYASLEGVLAVVNPVLVANGLCIHQIFDHTPEGQTVLKTILRHTSGEELVSSALYPQTTGKNPLHDWGKNCTYMRRYTLLAILGICSGIEDDDGNSLSPRPVISKPVVTTPKETQQGITKRPKPANPNDLKTIHGQIRALFTEDEKKCRRFGEAFRKEFNQESGNLPGLIQTLEQFKWTQKWLLDNQ